MKQGAAFRLQFSFFVNWWQYNKDDAEYTNIFALK